MIKKNGFTLIELLAAIIVLGMIALIVFPTVNKTIKNQREKLYDRQISTIIEAAEGWGIKNIDKLPMGEKESVSVNISTLVEEGLLKNNDIKDPRNGENMLGCVEIVFEGGFNQYVYSYIDSSAEDYVTKCLNF